MFGKIKISFRLYIMAISIVFIFIGFGFYISNLTYRDLVEARKMKVKNLTEVAISLIQDYYKMADAGLMSKEDALKAAIKNIRPMRFDAGTGYYYIYTGTTVIMLPPMPEREGKDFYDLKDANGVQVIKELRDTALSGGGFVEYYWDKPGSGITMKLGYAILIPDTNMWIGTGIYLDDV